MQRVTIIARIKAKPEFADQMKQESSGLIAPTRREQGCLTYDLHQSVEDPLLFLLHEVWESQALLEEHWKSDHLKPYRRATEGMIEQREITLLRNIEES